MLKRLAIYIKEMFPLGLYIPFAFINHYVLFFVVQKMLGADRLILSFYSLIGVSTIIGSMFIMRIFDELKDEVVDARLFAQRPYPRGAVLKKDLITALLITFFAVALLNAYRSYALPYFLACVFYGWLTYKWFFLKKYIQPNLMLALVTHQPISLLLNAYVVSTAMVQTQTFTWTREIFWTVFIFYIPVLAWELSRKIKAKGAENEYVTYSKILGTRMAAVLVMVVVLIFLGVLIYYGYLFNLSIVYFILLWIAVLCTLFIFLRFIIYPVQKNLHLKKASELVCTVASVLLLIFLCIEYGIELR